MIKSNRYTYEEYLELEEHSELRQEYYYGEIFALAGTSIVHNDIALNSTFALRTVLREKGKTCKVNSESVKVEIKSQNHYTYPDVVVSCSEKEDENKSIKYPILIVEVLSNSTRNLTTKSFLSTWRLRSR